MKIEQVFNAYDTDKIVEFIKNNEHNGKFVSVEITNKKQAKSIDVLLRENKELPSKVDLSEQDCSFDFGNKVYMYKNKRIHLTTGEVLFLYEHFVLGSNQAPRRFLHQIRRRLGNGFLVKENLR